MLVGWALCFNVPGLYAYAVVTAVGFHLRVVFGEEPWLARLHGDEWQRYSTAVPRWIW
jgi:protein-S-isoprenylcysteine O-methyltransferase Ste14